jgi:hypothetical protein
LASIALLSQTGVDINHFVLKHENIKVLHSACAPPENRVPNKHKKFEGMKVYETNKTESRRSRKMRWAFNFWPCIWCTGSRVQFIAGDFK